MMVTDYINTTADTIRKLNNVSTDIERFADMAITTLSNNHKIIFCGNGGSAADSQHLAAEFMGRFLKDRAPLPSIALTVDTSALTAIGNDYGYDQVFARQLRGIGQPGDLLVGISTSGDSANVVRAFRAAQDMGIKTVALTGQNPSNMSELADLTIHAPSTQTNHIQECHITIGHLVCKIVEQAMFP